MAAAAGRPDYGIDAPHVIRNLAIAGGVALAVWIAAAAGVAPHVLRIPVGVAVLLFPLGTNLLIIAVVFLAMAAWMYGSRYGKIAERERLTTGAAVGVDIWQAEDLSGNRPEAPVRNADIEGVGGRVSVRTADMRHLPFDDRSFDVIVSRAAIHNLCAADDRAAAIREIARVLAPGGRALISDIRHIHEYARTFAGQGCGDVRLLGSTAVSALYALVTLGSLRLNTMLVRKAA